MSHIKNDTEKNLEKTKKFEPKVKTQKTTEFVPNFKIAKKFSKKEINETDILSDKNKNIKNTENFQKENIRNPFQKRKIFQKMEIKNIRSVNKMANKSCHTKISLHIQKQKNLKLKENLLSKITLSPTTNIKNKKQSINLYFQGEYSPAVYHRRHSFPSFRFGESTPPSLIINLSSLQSTPASLSSP